MDKTFASSEGRFFQPLILFLFVMTVLTGSFYSAREFFLKRSVSVNHEATLLAQAQMESLSGDDVAALLAAQNLKKEVEANRVPWSALVKELKQLTPLSVSIFSYTAGEDGQVRLAGTADTALTVGAFWAALDKSPSFDRVFVPSISVGRDDAGQCVVSFSINLSTQPHESNPN